MEDLILDRLNKLAIYIVWAFLQVHMAQENILVVLLDDAIIVCIVRLENRFHVWL